MKPRYGPTGEPRTIPWEMKGDDLYAAAQMLAESQLTALSSSSASPSLFDFYNRTLESVTRHLNHDYQQLSQLLSGSLDLGTPGEYTTGSLKKLLKYLQENCSVTQTSVFCDVGSGIGRPVFAAILTSTFKYAVGVEIVEQQVDSCRKTAAKFGIPNCQFLHVDASKHTPPFDATHVYIFSQGFDGKLQSAVAKQLNAHRSWEYLCTATPPEKWRKVGLKFDRILTLLTGMTMVGSNRAYAVYVLARRPVAPSASATGSRGGRSREGEAAASSSSSSSSSSSVAATAAASSSEEYASSSSSSSSSTGKGASASSSSGHGSSSTDEPEVHASRSRSRSTAAAASVADAQPAAKKRKTRG